MVLKMGSTLPIIWRAPYKAPALYPTRSELNKNSSLRGNSHKNTHVRSHQKHILSQPLVTAPFQNDRFDMTCHRPLHCWSAVADPAWPVWSRWRKANPNTSTKLHPTPRVWQQNHNSECGCKKHTGLLQKIQICLQAKLITVQPWGVVSRLLGILLFWLETHQKEFIEKVEPKKLPLPIPQHPGLFLELYLDGQNSIKMHYCI